MKELIADLGMATALVLLVWSYFSAAFCRGMGDVLLWAAARLYARADAREHFASKKQEREVYWSERVEATRRAA